MHWNLRHKRNNHIDRGRPNNVLVFQLLGRSFQRARNFTASSHQNAGFSIWVFKKFSGDDTPGLYHPRTLTTEGGDPLPHPTPSPAFGGAGGASARCWDPDLGPLQLFSRVCAPDQQMLDWTYLSVREHLNVPYVLSSANIKDRLQTANMESVKGIDGRRYRRLYLTVISVVLC